MLRAPLTALVIVLGGLALAGSVRADPRFDPSFEVTLTQPAPQSASELKLNFRLDSGYQLSTAVLYIPYDWGVVRGEEIPIGTKVASTDSIGIYGFVNSACDQTFPITFELFNASLDPSQTVAFNDTELQQGLDPSTPGIGIQDFAEDKDANGLFDAIDHNPDFLLSRQRPIARLAGIATLAGTPFLLQFLIFAPGTRLDFPDPALTQLIADVPQSGYPMVMVFQDFRNPDNSRAPGPVTDYCTPTETTISVLHTDPPLLVNPQSGSYVFTLVASSKRDADGDGFENSLDTCPFSANAGSPTILAHGDTDQDGMDAACDPNDDALSAGANADEDGDQYVNRQDNCPLVVNGYTDWRAVPVPEPPGNQADQDFDDIGDVCDVNPDVPDGEAILATSTVEVIVGEPSGSGGPPSVDACPHCYRPGTRPVDAEAQDEGSGGQLAVAIGLIAVGTGAAAVVIGSGALYLIRRRRG
jgi:hypothetical protein